MTPETLRERVAAAVDAYVGARLRALGLAPGAARSTDLFAQRILDSVALTGLVAAVEAATSREIDFIDIDPDALASIDGIVDEFTRVIGGGV
jgi:hypothetical protein